MELVEEDPWTGEWVEFRVLRDYAEKHRIGGVKQKKGDKGKNIRLVSKGSSREESRGDVRRSLRPSPFRPQVRQN